MSRLPALVKLVDDKKRGIDSAEDDSNSSKKAKLTIGIVKIENEHSFVETDDGERLFFENILYFNPYRVLSIDDDSWVIDAATQTRLYFRRNKNGTHMSDPTKEEGCAGTAFKEGMRVSYERRDPSQLKKFESGQQVVIYRNWEPEGLSLPQGFDAFAFSVKATS